MTIPVTGFAESIDKFCFSKSGKSFYHINLDIKSLRGVLDYEFIGQKVTYNITEIKRDNNSFKGIAVFLLSKTGETKGNSFIFTYDLGKNLFIENNMIYECR